MEVIIQPDPEAVQSLALEVIRRQLERKRDSVLGLATGATMEGLYEAIVEQDLDLSGVTSFNLDEYLGLAPDHPCSYRSYMQRHLFQFVELKEVHLLDGSVTHYEAHCAEYEEKIAACGGIDLQLLGLGVDGHIAFNEPGSSLASRTRVKTLTPITRNSNARHFPPGAEVPPHVLTMGLGTIMDTRCCLLLAYGEAKAGAVRDMVEGPVSARCPASVLQMHPRCLTVLDEAAAGGLEFRDYYRYAYQNRIQEKF